MNVGRTFVASLLGGWFAASAAQPAQLASQSLDELDHIDAWKTIASDGARASLHEARGMDGGALVVEFDFAHTAGYAGAARALAVSLPDDFELSFWLRGVAGRNHLELKFVDATGENVWWFRQPDFAFSGEWQQVRIKRRQIQFAWGPAQDRTLRGFASIEFVIAAGADGGRGQLWLDQLSLKPIERGVPTAQPTVRATTQYRGKLAALMLDGSSATAWRSDPASSRPQVVDLDLQAVREFGGIEIDWTPESYAKRYELAVSIDGHTWKTVRTVTDGDGGRDSHFLPESEARYLRLTIPRSPRGVGILELHVRDIAFGESADAFLRSVASGARRGCYARTYANEQTYWTIVGADGGEEESLLSEDGALEARKGSFSIEPMLRTSEGWLTWADVEVTQSLAEGYLPVPSVEWRHADVRLNTTAYASGKGSSQQTSVVYRVSNKRSQPQHLTLALLVRPYQVNPPAQFLNTAGGVSPIQELAYQRGAVWVDDIPRIYPRTRPAAFRAAALDAGPPCEWLMRRQGSSQARDDAGFASGALLFNLELAAQASQDVIVDLPLRVGVAAAPATALEDVATHWRSTLNRVQFEVPKASQSIVDTLRTALAHVLINRDGAALQPGSRSYERSWIRDAALTSEMLLRLGEDDVVKAFVRWFAPYQFANGKVPCCVDRRGADPVPEHDSAGEFLFLVDETYRYTKDRELLEELWPAVGKAVAYLDQLRLSERTPRNQVEGRQVFYGLLPASISHEGYAAKPMHSYWDNFWALAGYESAVRMARVLGRDEQMRRWITARDEFRADLYRSLRTAIKAHRIEYLPGAAELGDFDPTSTTVALAPLGDQQMLPPLALEATFERYWQEFSQRRASTAWDAYTPYEWRNVSAFIRLGWRERAWQLTEWFMQDRRPAPWNQWAEVVGRESRRIRFIGDMPHGWVASDYGRAVLDMFAYERPSDDTLVLMAGIPVEWIRRDGFGVRGLRTPYGPLSYRVEVTAGRRVLDVEGIELPLGGVAIAWPSGERPARQKITRGAARWIDEELRISRLPFTIEFPN